MKMASVCYILIPLEMFLLHYLYLALFCGNTFASQITFYSVCVCVMLTKVKVEEEYDDWRPAGLSQRVGAPDV